MRRFISGMAAAALLALGGGVQAQIIAVSPTTWDFGNMKQQEARTTEVKIENQGAGRLVIEEVKADCGCTVPELAVKELGPGEATVLTIEFNSKKFAGHVVKAVQVVSNDPRSPVVDVMIMANVYAPLVIDPASQRLGFEQSLIGETATRTATFTSPEVPELILEIDHSRRGIYGAVVKNGVDGDPQKSILEVTLRADTPPGQQKDVVRISTNVPDMPTVDFEIASFVRPPLVASPDRVNWRYRNELLQNVRIRAYNNQNNFKVTGLDIDLPEIDASILTVAPGGEVIIKLEGAPIGKDDPRAIANEGRIQGTLIVHTDDASMPTVEVPITYMVRM